MHTSLRLPSSLTRGGVRASGRVLTPHPWVPDSCLDAAQVQKLTPALDTQDKFSDTMAVDKKVANGKLRLILLKGKLGECVFTGDFDATKLDETLDAFTAQ